MDIKPKDGLLAAAKVVSTLCQFVFIFGMVMLGIGIGAILTVGRAELLADIATSGAPAASFWLIALAMLTGMALLALGFRFFQELNGIIDSVDEGEPFRPENAKRLSRMGWISVIAHIGVLPIAGLSLWLAPYADKVGHDVDVGAGVDVSGVLLTLILFILARVFRHGAAMREELEGTV
jgi:Protein of unknown function (DUF2975)